MIWWLARLGRLRFWFLASRYDARVFSTIYVLVSSFVCMGALGLVTMLSSWQLIFPSLGPTIFLQFHAPALPAASPRNTVGGHFIGVVTGLVFFWLARHFHVDMGHLSVFHIFLAALALGTSGSVMAFTGLIHPPAAATTLIAALGMVSRWQDIAVIVVSAMLLSVCAWVLHRLSGVKFPIWSPLPVDSGQLMVTKLGELQLGQGPRDPAARMAARLKARQSPFD